MTSERCEPILPSRDLAETRTFWSRLGFRCWFNAEDWPGYEIVSRGEIVLHFFLDQERRVHDAGCYWRVKNVDVLYEEFKLLGLPSTGAPGLSPPENTPWGMREFNLIDPSGNLIRVGCDVKEDTRP